MKTCTKCNKEKEFSEFHTDNRSKDLLTSHCKLCRKKHHQLRKEEIREYKTEYARNNPEKVKEIRKRFYQNNSEKVKRKSKEYYHSCKDIISIKRKLKRDAAKEKTL